MRRERVISVGSPHACCERIQQRSFGIDEENEGIAMESVSVMQASSALRLRP